MTTTYSTCRTNAITLRSMMHNTGITSVVHEQYGTVTRDDVAGTIDQITTRLMGRLVERNLKALTDARNAARIAHAADGTQANAARYYEEQNQLDRAHGAI